MKRIAIGLAYGVAGWLVVSVGFGAYGLYQEHKALVNWVVQVERNSAQQAQQPGEPQPGGKKTGEAKSAK